MAKAKKKKKETDGEEAEELDQAAAEAALDGIVESEPEPEPEPEDEDEPDEEEEEEDEDEVDEPKPRKRDRMDFVSQAEATKERREAPVTVKSPELRESKLWLNKPGCEGQITFDEFGEATVPQYIADELMRIHPHVTIAEKKKRSRR